MYTQVLYMKYGESDTQAACSETSLNPLSKRNDTQSNHVPIYEKLICRSQNCSISKWMEYDLCNYDHDPCNYYQSVNR